MNDLQVALIAVGAAGVAGVWGYNKWQERQQGKLAQKVFRGGQADALLPAKEDVPPVTAEIPTDSNDAAERLEPMMAASGIATGRETEGGDRPPLPTELVDEVADCVVRIDFVEPVHAPGLWAGQSRWASHITKPMSWLGFDQSAGEWQLISANDAGRYKVVYAALQLADRQGAVTDAELSVFLDGVWELAGQCSGVVGMPKRDDVLMTARNLDDFCANVDLQLGVNIVGANEPLAGPRLQELAEGAGLRLLNDGCFHYLDNAGLTRFTLANIGAELFDPASMASLATHGVTLSMDVPRVPEGPAAFDALIAVARPLTEALGGILVDSQGNPLTAEMVASIRAKIAEIQARMAHHQIVAGSVRALRLFA
jgi:hypothetical protein